jgi:hypothetical protein
VPLVTGYLGNYCIHEATMTSNSSGHVSSFLTATSSWHFLAVSKLYQPARSRLVGVGVGVGVARSSVVVLVSTVIRGPIAFAGLVEVSFFALDDDTTPYQIATRRIY